jgi:hypothetical protein
MSAIGTKRTSGDWPDPLKRQKVGNLLAPTYIQADVNFFKIRRTQLAGQRRILCLFA